MRFKTINRTIVGIILICNLAISENHAQITKTTTETTPSILFIGNSYLEFNNLPDLFEALADAESKNIDVYSRIQNGQGLDFFAYDIVTTNMIESKKWDYIVLQSGSLYLAKPEWHQYIKPYLKELCNTIKANSSHTIIIYMMPWAYEDGLLWMQGGVDDFYAMSEDLYHESIKLINEFGVTLAPVGWAWYQAMMNDATLELFLDDKSHPSLNGSYLSACVFYCTVFMESVRDNSYHSQLDNNVAASFQDIATLTVVDQFDLWNIYDLDRTTVSVDDNITENTLSVYPNPCKTQTNFVINTDKPSTIELSIFNVLGQKVTSIYENYSSSGEHTLKFTRDDDHPNGLYFYQLKVNNQKYTGSLILN